MFRVCIWVCLSLKNEFALLIDLFNDYFLNQMIRKCNTAHNSNTYTPYNQINTSEFIQNEED